MTKHDRLRLGTRGSQLAQWQARWVASQLAEHDVEVEIVLIRTQGDQASGPIGSLGEQGVFTKEIQRALQENRVDLAVHSLKDLPTEPVEGLGLAAVPPREVNSDVLVCNAYQHWIDLPDESRVGTGSSRRKAQLLHDRPAMRVLDIRGNVETRLRKLDDGEYDAIVLAEAGLRRLGFVDRVTQVLPFSLMLPAVGQGALGIETRLDDAATRDTLQVLNCPVTRAAVTAERAMLSGLRGGCLAPVGAWARVADSRLRLDAVVLSHDGRLRIDAQGDTVAPAENSTREGSSTAGGAALDDADQLGREVAEKLLSDGAADLITRARNP